MMDFVFKMMILMQTSRWVAVLLFSYNLALVPPCMIISLVFSKVKSASNASGVFTVPILLSIPLGLLGGFHGMKAFLSLLGPVGFSLALGRIVELEAQGKGLHWDTAGLDDGVVTPHAIPIRACFGEIDSPSALDFSSISDGLIMIAGVGDDFILDVVYDDEPRDGALHCAHVSTHRLSRSSSTWDLCIHL